MMEKTVQQMFAKRRTNYTLGKDVTLSQEEITARIEAVVREVPSAFNMQSGRIIIAYGSAHDKIWQITKDTLRTVVPADAFANTEKKIVCPVDTLFQYGPGCQSAALQSPHRRSPGQRIRRAFFMEAHCPDALRPAPEPAGTD